MTATQLDFQLKFVSLIVLFIVMTQVQTGQSKGQHSKAFKKRQSVSPNANEIVSEENDGSFLSMSGAKARVFNCNDTDGKAWHHRSQNCYDVISQGPCGKLQIFYRHSVTPKLGRCSCVYNDDGCNTRGFPEISGVRKINRPLAMAPDRRRCYYTFSQGPCPQGSWYVIDSTKRVPVCQLNPCTKPLEPTIKEGKVQKTINNPESDVFWYSLNGTCYQTFTQGHCGPNEFARFWGTDPRPSCMLISQPRRSCILRPSTSLITCQQSNGANCQSLSTTHFSKSTLEELICDPAFQYKNNQCVPYGIFETGFTGEVIKAITPTAEAELGRTWHKKKYGKTPVNGVASLEDEGRGKTVPNVPKSTNFKGGDNKDTDDENSDEFGMVFPNENDFETFPDYGKGKDATKSKGKSGAGKNEIRMDIPK